MLYVLFAATKVETAGNSLNTGSIGQYIFMKQAQYAIFPEVKVYYKNIQVVDLSNSLINFLNYFIDRLNVGERRLPVCWQNSQLKPYFKLTAWGGGGQLLI